MHDLKACLWICREAPIKYIENTNTSQTSFCKAALNKCKTLIPGFESGHINTTHGLESEDCQSVGIKTFHYRLIPAPPPDKTHWNIEIQDDATYFLVKLSRQVFM